MAKNNRRGAGEATDKTRPKSTKAVARKKPGNAAVPAAAPQSIQSTETTALASSSNPEHPSIQNEMEVHHHPQLEHKPKPWKEYLLEGFMIFVAVMMGFIAENIRESITNSEHVKELTAQLAQDIKADTTQLNEIYREELKISKANDTLVSLLQQPFKKEEIGHIQKLVVASHSMWPFHQSAGAINAIKYELHLKQFSSSKIISYISEYEKHVELRHTVQDITLQYQRSFIDPFLLKHFTGASLDAAFKKHPQASPQPRNLSQEDIDQLSADMILIRINTEELLADNLRVKNDAIKLLDYLKKQFDIEED
ncbi:hypothetical protein ACFFGT_25545 [Mucilaginibacter angelicae]|uniref:Uncharacterized protein n=1 Tax=Mucilaginibacter angelicae TaxID=869718 RepID=A0ABV6LDM9_9SPHI